MRPTRILLVDDHPVLRRGLRLLFKAQRGITVCGEAASGRQAVKLAKKLLPDVAFVDISLPDINGLEVTREIRKVSPNTQVIVLTMHESETVLGEALQAGARGYILKTEDEIHLLNAVKALAKNRPYFTPKAAEKIVRLHRRPALKSQALPPRLTPRELQVIQLLGEGCSSKEVAFRLGLSVRTIEAYRGKIMRKLGARGVSDVIRYAIRHEIIQL